MATHINHARSQREAPSSPLAAALGGCVALAVAMGIGRFALTPILPFMIDELGLAASDAGLIAAANFFGYLLGALVGATPLIARARSAWLVAGLAISAATTACMGISDALGALMAIRFLGGLASAFTLVAASGLVLDALATAGRIDLSAVHFGGVGVGIVISAVTVPLLALLALDWPGLWLGTGLVATAGALLAARLVARPGSSRAAGSGDAALGLDRRLITLALAYGLFGYGYVITATFIVTIARRTAEALWLEPLVWVVVGLAAMPSVALWGAASRRHGIFRSFALACLVEAVGVAASVLLPPTAGLVLGAVFLGGTFMGLTALGLAAARSLRPAAATRAMALLTAAFGAGQILGPLVAGLLADVTGSFFLPSLSAAALLLVAALLSWQAAPADAPR